MPWDFPVLKAKKKTKSKVDVLNPLQYIEISKKKKAKKTASKKAKK